MIESPILSYRFSKNPQPGQALVGVTFSILTFVLLVGDQENESGFIAFSPSFCCLWFYCLLKGNILPHAHTFSFITLSKTNDGNSSYFSRCELLGWLSACFWSLEPEKVSFSEIALWCTNNTNLISCLEWTQSLPVSSQVCCRLWKNRKHAPFFCKFHQDPCEWNILTSCFHEKYYRSQSCQRQRTEWASQGAKQGHADSMFWYPACLWLRTLKTIYAHSSERGLICLSSLMKQTSIGYA